MKKLIISILFYLFLFSTSYSETITKIDITGNTRVSDETIIIYGEIKLDQEYNEKKLDQILKNLYSTNFFKDIKIFLNNSILQIQIIEHPIVNELVLIGEPRKSYADQIRKMMKLKEKDSFIESNLSQDIDVIKKIYAAEGYNFAKVETKIREIDNKNLDLIISIDRGQITKISKISFIGDKKVREKRLRDVIASQENKFWKFISKNTKFSQELVNLDLRLLRNYYKSLGYYDVEISSNSAEIKKSGEIKLLYSIEAGNRYIIKKIMVNSDPVFDSNIFYPLNEEFNKVIGEYYSPFKVKNLLEDIDDLIEKNNLQFVEHNVEEIIEDKSIVIKFNVFEGDKVLVERINILGNNITNETVIRSELLMDEGDPFTNLRLEKSISEIKARRIFKDVVSTVKNGTENNLKIIDIEVEEQATGEISAGAGIGTGGGSFSFAVNENNYLGAGKKVGFSLDLKEEAIKGSFNYIDPNYDFLGNSIEYSLFSISNDRPNQGYENNILGLSAGTSFEQYKDIYATLGLSASFDDMKTKSTASESLKKQSGEFSEISGNYGFTFDQRNRPFMPTAGTITSFSQTLPVYADRKFLASSISTSTYKAITENIIGAGKFYLAAINGIGNDDVRLSKRKNISTSGLRGFESGKVGPVDGADHVGGNYVSSLNFEASLPKLLPEYTQTDISLFLDFANVWGVDYSDDLDDSNKIRSSTGVGASWASPLGPMTFILSTNISKASTDVTESFNFNLGTTF